MEETKKRGNILIIILVVLLFISVGVICYLLGVNSSNDNNKNNEGNNITQNENSETNKDSNVEKVEEDDSITPVSYQPKCVYSVAKEQNLTVDIDVTKYNNIADYIKKQQNVQISMDYCKIDKETYEILGETNYKLTDEEKNKVFDEIKTNELQILRAGIGGACVPILKIDYERENKEYFVEYFGFSVMTSNDGNIYKIIDKSVDNNLSEPDFCLYGNGTQKLIIAEQIFNNLRTNN